MREISAGDVNDWHSKWKEWWLGLSAEQKKSWIDRWLKAKGIATDADLLAIEEDLGAPKAPQGLFEE